MTLTRDLARLHSDSDGNLIIANNLTVDTNTLKVDAANNRVGIGTASPTSRLHIKASNGGYTGGIQIENHNDSTKGAITLSSDNLYISSNSTNDHMSILANGNVGIGTTSPDLPLDVSSSVSNSYVATFQNTANNLELKIGTVAGGLLNIQGANATNDAAYQIALNAEGGNVGIGTAAPNDKVVAIVGNGGGILQATYDNGTATSGQQLGGVGFKGYASGNSIAAADAKVVGFADGAHSGSSAPGRLEFYTKPSTTGPGSGASKRYTITSHGEHTYEINERGWTVNAYSLTGGTYEYQCRKRFSTGSSAGTYDVLRFKRHYWGSGSVRLDVRQTYYVTTEDNTFWLQGHGRNDGVSYTPTWSLGHTGNQNSSSSRLSLDTTGGSSSPGNAIANYVDVQIYVPAYTQYYVTAYVAHSTYYTDPSSMSDANSFALH